MTKRALTPLEKRVLGLVREGKSLTDVHRIVTSEGQYCPVRLISFAHMACQGEVYYPWGGELKMTFTCRACGGTNYTEHTVRGGDVLVCENPYCQADLRVTLDRAYVVELSPDHAQILRQQDRLLSLINRINDVMDRQMESRADVLTQDIERLICELEKLFPEEG